MARPRTGAGRGPNVPGQRSLAVECLIGLRQVVREERGHRELDHLLNFPLQFGDRLREFPRDPSVRLQEWSDPRGQFFPQVAHVLQADRDDAIPEEVPRIRAPNAYLERSVLVRAGLLMRDASVQAMVLEF